MKLPLSLLFLYMVIVHTSMGQSDPKLSVFTFNPLYYNPAFAGAGGGLSVIGIHSSQFTGFDGAPNTQYISAHGLWEESNLGLGVDMMNDNFGILGETSFNANISYYLRLSTNWRLSFGFKAGVNQYRADYTKLNIADPDEDVINEQNLNVFQPNLGFGFYLYNQNFYLGLSAPSIMNANKYAPIEIGFDPGKANYYLMSGLNLPVGYKSSVMSSVLVRTVNGAPTSGLFSISLDYENMFFVGANYEYNSSMGLMAGTVLAEKFKWGYAYDFPTNGLARYTKGTHTFFISLHLSQFKKGSNMPCFYY